MGMWRAAGNTALSGKSGRPGLTLWPRGASAGLFHNSQRTCRLFQQPRRTTLSLGPKSFPGIISFNPRAIPVMVSEVILQMAPQLVRVQGHVLHCFSISRARQSSSAHEPGSNTPRAPPPPNTILFLLPAPRLTPHLCSSPIISTAPWKRPLMATWRHLLLPAFWFPWTTGY